MSLPLKIKVGVRDKWNDTSSQIQKALVELKATLGLDVAVEPQWALLWNELSASFKEADQFVPIIAEATTLWVKALGEIADDDKNEEWTEELLDKVKSSGSMLRIELEAGREDMPGTSWSERSRGFVICFPKKVENPFTMTNEMAAKFHGELLGAFKPAKKAKSSSKEAAAAPSTESWVGVGDDDSNFDSASVMTPSTAGGNYPIRSAVPEKLPDVASLDRPEFLLHRAPYHMIVKASDRLIVVEASHQPSLELLSKYLKKYTKANHNITTRPPLVQTELRGSVFGLSTMWDRLEIEPQHNDSWTKVNPMLILCFLENILGYRVTFQDVGYWHFRREVDFK